MRFKNRSVGISSRFLLFASLISISVLSFAFLNSSSNEASAESQSASHGSSAYTASISNEDSISIPVTPTATQATYTGVDDITYSSTCPKGATITIQTDSNDNNLTRIGTDELTKTIDPTTNTSGTLSNNSWGFSTDGTNYKAVPILGSPVIMYNGTKAEEKTVSVTYGIRIDDTLPSGTYTNNVIYTVAVKPECISYTLSFDLDGGTGASGVDYSDQTLGYGDTINLSTYKPTKEGYTFTGWTNGSDSFTGEETNVDINPDNALALTLKANWELARLYLYKDGDEVTSITNGWKIIYIEGSTCVKEADNFKWTTDGSRIYQICQIQAEKPIDLSNYTKVGIEARQIVSSFRLNTAGDTVTAPYIYLGIHPSKQTTWQDSGWAWGENAFYHSDIGDTGVFEEVTGKPTVNNGYLNIRLGTSRAFINQQTHIYKLWLE